MEKTMKIIMMLVGFAVMATACKKDDYYIDGGRAIATFDGTILEYLEAHPVHFDSLAQVIRLAGLEDVFNNDTLTFFAPNDRNIRELIGDYRRGGVNTELYRLNRDTIQQLSDIDPLIWRKYLLRYMFHGKNMLADYPQVDFSVLNAFPGQNYYSYDNTVCNIGVEFHDADANGSVLKYGGYRQLAISYIPNVSFPFADWQRVYVISSDIQPTNGVVHALAYLNSRFGFDNRMYFDIIDSKR
ncbi:hypothetical protein [Parapedobacter sp. 10938]|uniref:hypothetical protein n=1 Tax=Parapedobacter flavus TaxID=3110225 RepID=UPI002DBAA4EA|nr:hypothetical protein [Parapedobacter sp. 10938]